MTAAWTALRELFAKLVHVDHMARHLCESSGIDHTKRPLEATVDVDDLAVLEAALDAVDPNEGHDEQQRERMMATLDAAASIVEEAALSLVMLSDPLAALDAAERALLAAGGWTQDGDRWSHPDWQRECQQVAVTAERRLRLSRAAHGADGDRRRRLDAEHEARHGGLAAPSGGLASLDDSPAAQVLAEQRLADLDAHLRESVCHCAGIPGEVCPVHAPGGAS